LIFIGFSVSVRPIHHRRYGKFIRCFNHLQILLKVIIYITGRQYCVQCSIPSSIVRRGENSVPSDICPPSTRQWHGCAISETFAERNPERLETCTANIRGGRIECRKELRSQASRSTSEKLDLFEEFRDAYSGHRFAKAKIVMSLLSLSVSVEFWRSQSSA
jgi:hypothetical protein